MKELRVVIADDDAGMRTVMRHMIDKIENITLVGEAADGLELLRLVEELRPSIVFLDVEMPKMSGVECARAIQDMDPACVLIFATAHDQYMGDAFEVYAFDYLIKPFKVDRVLQTLERARDRLSGLTDKPLPPLTTKENKLAAGRLMLRHKEGVTFVDMDSILLVQREDRATVIYTADGERYMTNESLGDTEERLPKDIFFRCHKSYIINLNHIKNITPYGRWTYVVKLNGTTHDALITHEKYEELERIFA